MIKFDFNEQKAIELILYLSNRVSDPSVKKILKLLFYADEYHLNHYFRPIVGNVYNALPQGPVNSKLYDLTKENHKTDFSVCGYLKDIKTTRDADLKYFSKSDIEALEFSLKKYGKYTADELSEMTHSHKAWIKARERETSSDNPIIDWFDILSDENTKNEELKKDLEFKSVSLAF